MRFMFGVVRCFVYIRVCMPEALIAMSAGFLRQAFSSPVLSKPLVVFRFSRYDEPSEEMLVRLRAV